ncbi:hypothetical protein VZC37_23100 [Gordonia sp. LSe1-13]|uniref:Uncharacterized protein n=1 Tax=Gordonia sesuvii TaxID=3116777 RepID=A0ABU7MJG3_9ACTN|nr:hypothetical protein [Gordonia sp. LSe1-13]
MTAPTPDPIMTAIIAAVTTGQSGDAAAARAQLRTPWTEMGVLGDPLHRCTLAHHHADLHIDGFYPSLHLNLADDYRRLGAFAPANDHIDAARARSSHLADDPYGDLIRAAIDEVADAIERQDTAPRASAPGRN